MLLAPLARGEVEGFFEGGGKMERGAEAQFGGDFVKSGIGLEEQAAGAHEADSADVGPGGISCMLAEESSEMRVGDAEFFGEALHVDGLGVMGREVLLRVDDFLRDGGRLWCAAFAGCPGGEDLEGVGRDSRVEGSWRAAEAGVEGVERFVERGGGDVFSDRAGRSEGFCAEQGVDGRAFHFDPGFGPAGGGVGAVAVPDSGEDEEGGAGGDAFEAGGARLEPALAGLDRDELKRGDGAAGFPAEVVVVRMAGGRVRRAGIYLGVAGGGHGEAPRDAIVGEWKVAKVGRAGWRHFLHGKDHAANSRRAVDPVCCGDE